jgi:hypothetical protein
MQEFKDYNMEEYSYDQLKSMFIDHSNIDNDKLKNSYIIYNYAGNKYFQEKEKLINIIIKLIDDIGYSFNILQNENIVILINKYNEKCVKIQINYTLLNDIDDLNMIIFPTLFNNIILDEEINRKFINYLNKIFNEIQNSYNNNIQNRIINCEYIIEKFEIILENINDNNLKQILNNLLENIKKCIQQLNDRKIQTINGMIQNNLLDEMIFNINKIEEIIFNVNKLLDMSMNNIIKELLSMYIDNDIAEAIFHLSMNINRHKEFLYPYIDNDITKELLDDIIRLRVHNFSNMEGISTFRFYKICITIDYICNIGLSFSIIYIDYHDVNDDIFDDDFYIYDDHGHYLYNTNVLLYYDINFLYNNFKSANDLLNIIKRPLSLIDYYSETNR